MVKFHLISELREALFVKYKNIPSYKSTERRDLKKVITALDKYLKKYGSW